MQTQSSSTLSQFKLNYPKCLKQGDHKGEICNMICTETTCSDTPVGCNFCIRQSHKNHVTKPLKYLINEARENSQKTQPLQFKTDAIFNILKTNEEQALEILNTCRKDINKKLDCIEKSLIAYFDSVKQQIRQKSVDPQDAYKNVFCAVSNSQSIESLKSLIPKLIEMVPVNKSDVDFDFTEQELVSSLTRCNSQIKEMVGKIGEQVSSKLNQDDKKLQDEKNSLNLWKKSVSYKFSVKFKSKDVKIISENIVKSQNISGYKFALMEPGLEKGSPIKSYSFLLNQSSSNWIGVGMCHKNILAANNYGFNFNSIGHGAYLISANGGVWSNTSSESNNKIKGFKFNKGEVITVTVNLQSKKICFKKGLSKYEMDFKTIQGDELHPCIVFYYIYDEIEYLPGYKNDV